MDMETSRLLPVSVLTGFLGSGKTTVLNHLMQQPEMSRTLLVINRLVRSESIMISWSKVLTRSLWNVSGCLCCTIRGDLVKTLREAPGRFA